MKFSNRNLLLVTVIVVSILIAVPGFYLLNQEFRIIPTRRSYYVGSIRGLPISNAAIIGCSLSVAICVAVIGLLAFAGKKGPKSA
jgi:hypothetical protein